MRNEFVKEKKEGIVKRKKKFHIVQINKEYIYFISLD